MAKDRLIPCKYYLAFRMCSKNREADHKGYCQKCGKYEPRYKERHLNRKKQELDKIKRNERF